METGQRGGGDPVTSANGNGGVRRFVGSLIKKSSLYAVGDALTRGRQLILLPLYAAYLTPSEYGILALAIVVIQILQPALSFGLKAAALKFFFTFDTEDERRRFYGELWLFYVAGMGLLYWLLDLGGEQVFGLFFTQVPFAPYLRLALWTAFLTSAFLDIPRQIFRASGRPIAYGVLNVSNFLLTLGFAVWLVMLRDGGAVAAIQAELMATAVTAVGCTVFLLMYTKLPRHFERVWAAILFSAPMIPHFMAHWVLSTGDRVILEWFVPLAEIGIYNMGYIMGWSIVLIKVAIMNAMLPIYGHLDTEEREGRASLARLVTYYATALAVIGMAVVLFAPDVLNIVAPADYAGAVYIVPWATLGGFFLGLYTPSVQILSVTAGRTVVIGISTVLAAIANIALNILVIPVLGILGAAVTTAVTYLLLAVGALSFAQRECHIPYEYARLVTVVGTTGATSVAGLWFFSEPSLGNVMVKLVLVTLPVIFLWRADFFHLREFHVSTLQETR